MKKAAIRKRTAALALGGAMSLSCLAGALAMAFSGGKSVALAAGNIVNVDASMQYQTFDGWGTSLAWWANECGDWTRESANGTTQRDYIMQLLFGEEGLNWNIARYNVGGGENPEHSHLAFDTDMPGFQPNGRGSAFDWDNGDGTTKNWYDTVDARQLWVLDAFQKIRADIAEEKGTESDAITEFFSNSPPYWMLNNQCASGSGKTPNLKDDYIDDYVNYFVEVYKYLIDQGFTVDLLQPFNESSTSGEGWGTAAGNSGDQEGCAFSPQQKVQVIKGIMDKLAQEDPKYQAVGYNLGDEVDTGRANNELDAIARVSGGDAIVKGADKLTYHIYGYQINQAQQIYRRAKANGQKAEMSEITWTVSDVYDPSLMTTALSKYSQSIIDIVKYGAAESYVYWQGMENLTGLIKTGWNYGVLHGVYDNPARPSTVSGFDLASLGLTYQDVRTCKSYYVAGQYSKYIQPGYKIVQADEDRTLAAISPDGDKLIIVKENNSASTPTLNFNINSFGGKKVTKIYTDANHDWAKEVIANETTEFGNFADTITPYSVTTYVIEGVSKAGSAHIIDESARVTTSNFAAMQTEIEKYDEKEGLFVAGSWSNGSQSNTGSFAGLSIYNSGNGDWYAAVRFKGTGIGVLAERKSDSAVLQYWCDPELVSGALPATADGEVDTTNATHLYKQQVLRVNDMERGWHTVYLKVKEGYLNLDGIFVIDGEDEAATANKPVITNLVGHNATLYVGFDGVKDATDYTVEYRKNGTDSWTEQSVGTATTATIKINSFTAGAYDVRVKATVDSGSVYSDICSVNINAVPDGLLYYVDCGTSNFNDGGWGRVYGSCQSTFDQDYGTDSITGLKWGISNKGYEGAGWRDEDPFSSILYGDSGKTVAYKFTIPKAGNYVLTVGGFRPEGWGNRTATATITGTGMSSNPSGQYSAKDSVASIAAIKFTTTEDNKEITVTIPSPGGLALLVITEENKPIPIMAEAKSNYTMNGSYDHTGIKDNGTKYLGEELTDEASFNLVMSDGTKQAVSTSDGSLNIVSKELSKMAAGEYYTIGYTVGGSIWKEGWPEMTAYATYLLEVKKQITQEYEEIKPEELFYFIDSGSDGTAAFTKGSLQTDNTHDQKYNGSNGWGYVDKRTGTTGCEWRNDVPESSIREMDSGSGYVMTGFEPNQEFTLEIGMNVHDWSTRKADIYVGGTYANDKITGGEKVGSIESTKNGGVRVGTFEVAADENGMLVVSFIKVSGDNPQVAYLRVSIPGIYQEEISSGTPALPAIKVGQTAYFRQDFETGHEPAIELKGLEVGATVYIIDSNDMLVDCFKATSATMQWNNWDKVAEDAYGLRFTQAKYEDGEKPISSSSGSPETVVALPKIIVNVKDGTVKLGDKIAISVAPRLGKVDKNIFGSIDSIKIRRPDGVEADIIGSFFYRTTKNGAHVLTVSCNGVIHTETIMVEGIESIDMQAEFSEEGWTDDDVTITLTPVLGGGASIKEVTYVKDDDESTKDTLTENGGKYVITATENAKYTVTVETENGSVKSFVYYVTNIDKSEEPVLTMSIVYTQTGGVKFNYSVSGTESGGMLYVKQNGGDAVAVENLNSFTATLSGKYEFYFVSSTGKTSNSYTFYVASKAAQAALGTVTIGSDGTVSVSGSGLTVKLYRAGSATPLTSLNVANEGQYYLEITNAEGEKEVVVIDTAATSTADHVSVVEAPAATTTAKKKDGGSASTDLILTIVFAVLAAAAVAGVVVIVIKRRKA